MNENELLEKINAGFDTMSTKFEAMIEQHTKTVASLTEEVNNLKAEMLALKEQATAAQKENEKEKEKEKEKDDEEAKKDSEKDNKKDDSKQTDSAKSRGNNVNISIIDTDGNSDDFEAQVKEMALGFQLEPIA